LQTFRAQHPFPELTNEARIGLGKWPPRCHPARFTFTRCVVKSKLLQENLPTLSHIVLTSVQNCDNLLSCHMFWVLCPAGGCVCACIYRLMIGSKLRAECRETKNFDIS
jgi:hypothetical protein